MATSLYACVYVLMYIWLTLNTVSTRQEHQQRIGDGGHQPLQQAIRAHGHFAEYTPFALILLVLLELNGAHAYFIHGFGMAFFIARLMHAYGLLRAETYDDKGEFTGTIIFRKRGMQLMIFTFIGMVGTLIYQYAVMQFGI